MAYALVWADRLYAGLANGTILASDDGGDGWEKHGVRLPTRIAV